MEDPETGRRKFEFQKGPIFAQIVLADEVNRATPKSQSALLEAMQERSVTVSGTMYKLDQPFFVLATQNPIEQEGTYPLPEAQLDRFTFKLVVGYPTADQELTVLDRHHRGLDPHDVTAAGVRPVAGAGELDAARRLVAGVGVAPTVLEYIVSLCRATRELPAVEVGVSPRGATALLHASKAWAWLSGRAWVSPDEVKAVAVPTLRHRLVVRPELELEGTTADGILTSLLASVPAPR
jgi:MoxR-like ATPase